MVQRSRFEGMTLAQAKKWALPFGKYKGEFIEDVYQEDQQYIDWLYEKLKDTDKLKQAIELVCYTKED